MIPYNFQGWRKFKEKRANMRRNGKQIEKIVIKWTAIPENMIKKDI